MKAKSVDSRGFSLIEILLTLLLASILVTIAAFSYQIAARRNLLQSEAIEILARIEQARADAESQLESKSAQGTEYRIRFNPGGCGCYIPEYYDTAPMPAVWVASSAISAQPILLNSQLSFGLDSRSPAIGISPSDQPAGAPVQSTEIRFNSRGFPVDPTSGPPSNPTQANAIYITDGENSFAITVSILGQGAIWSFDRGGTNQWVRVSR